MNLPSRPFQASYGRLPYGPVRKARDGKSSSLVAIPEEVAVLDEHDLKDEDGQLITRLTPEKLQRIADNNNKRIDDTGDYCPIVIGHTKDDDPERGIVIHEKDQPEIIGYAGPFRVKKFFKTGKKAIFAKWRVFKDKLDLLRKFPRRSVELWVSRWEIDPISVLGATTPDRDLGLVKLARPAAGKQSYTITRSNSQMDVNELVQQVVAALQQTSEWQFLSQLSQEAQNMGDDQAEGGGEMPPPDNSMGGDTSGGSMNPQEQPIQAEDDGQGFEPDVGDAEYEGEDVPEEMPIQKAAPVIGKPKPGQIYSQTGGQKGDAAKVYCGRDGKPIQKAMSAPSGSNTFVPNYGAKKQLSRKPDQERIRMARVEQQAKNTQEETRQLRVRLARAERERDLIQMEAEGLVLDRDEELEYVAPVDGEPMDEMAYGRHVTMIRKRYQRFGGNGPGQVPRPRASQPLTNQTNQARVKAAVDMATAKGIKFDEAYERVGGEPVL